MSGGDLASAMADFALRWSGVAAFALLCAGFARSLFTGDDA